jgi:hypothetical protein
MHLKMTERIMRLLAATLGALLISVSHPALTQEHYRSLPHAMWQQGEDSRQSEAQPAEQRPEIPQPQTEQAEVQPPAMPEPQTEQVEMQQPAAPEPPPAQAEIQQPAMPEPQTEQAAMPQPAMPEPQPEHAAVPQPPAMPEPPTEQAVIQPPPMPEPQTEQQAAIQQPAAPEPQAEQPVMQGMAQDIALPRDARWTVFVEPSLGTRMDLPSAVFATADGAAYRGVGRQFKTADGRAALAVYSQRNSQRDTPASYLRKNFSFPRTTVTYERITRDFFAVSGVRDDKIFYSRCNVSATGGTLHCFDMQFPAAERAAWDAIVTRMSRSLRPLHRS